MQGLGSLFNSVALVILAELIHGGEMEPGKREGGQPWCAGTGEGPPAHLITDSLLSAVGSSGHSDAQISISEQPFFIDNCQHVTVFFVTKRQYCVIT